jgi:hypothetical protein
MSLAFNNTNYRRNYHANIAIVPPATEQALVFHFDKDNKKFDKNFYSEAQTDGRASTNLVSDFLEEVEDAFKRRFKWLRYLKIYLTICFTLKFFFLMLYSIFFMFDFSDDEYYYDNSDYNEYSPSKNYHSTSFRQTQRDEWDYDDEFDTVFIAWAGFMLAVTFWSIVVGIYNSYCYRKVRKDVQGVVDKNSQLFASYGLRWNLPLSFPHWIELWKDYKGQNYNQGQIQFNFGQVNQVQQQPQSQLHNLIKVQRYPTFNETNPKDSHLDYQHNLLDKPLLDF